MRGAKSYGEGRGATVSPSLRPRRGRNPASRVLLSRHLAGLALASVFLGLASPAGAQSRAADATTTLPTVIVTAPQQACDRSADGGLDYACLNAALVEAGRPPRSRELVNPVMGEAATPSRIGAFSYAATSQRMGANFGVAATPFRPPAAVFGNSLTGARAVP